MSTLSLLLVFNYQSSQLAAEAQLQQDAPGALSDLLDSLPVVYSDSVIELRSDSNLPDTKQLASCLEDAFLFDLNSQGLNSVNGCQSPFTVGLASQAAVQRFIHTKMGGRALGPKGFVAHVEGFLEPASSYNWYVAGHEFEHILMARVKAIQPALPTYLVEGIATCIGAHYVRKSGMGTQALQMQARKLAAVSVNEAQDIFQNFVTRDDVARYRTDGKLFMGEVIGGLFVEFLATRKSRSPKSFFTEWGSFARELGAGAQLEAAFLKHFGLSLGQSQRDFLKYIASTEGNSQARFDNTVYQAYQR